MLDKKRIDSVLEFLDCDREFLDELISMYKIELNECINTLAEKDIEQKTIKSATHKIAGTTALLQLTSLHKSLKETEHLAEQSKCTPTILEAMIKDLKDCLVSF